MTIRIALAGNPNSGKTTLFNALTGATARVGNWPGVTVERKEGRLKGRKDVLIQDLPGIYSLSPYTLEEVVARNYLVDERPDVIINIIDGTNLERNLYLTTQLTELGIPVLAAVNMIDAVDKSGDKIDTEALAKALGCPVVCISALKGSGLQEAVRKAVEIASGGKTIPQHSFSGSVEHAIAHIEEAVLHDLPEEQQRWYAIKLFERDERIIEKLNISETAWSHIEQDIAHCEREMDDDSGSIITCERYAYITGIIDDCLQKQNTSKMTASDKIDRIVTSRLLGLPIFVAVMTLVYYVSVTTVGTWVTDFANDTFVGAWLQEPVGAWLESVGTAEWLTGLIVDGIIGGVGAVIGFLPQLLILFFFLAILEDCGYMARIAFLMDRIFRKFGMSGKSFIPLLIGTGCGIPGIMAARTVEQQRDRRMTIMTTTFMPCGAKLPVIALISGAVFGGAGWVAPSAYFLGIGAVIVTGIMLKKTKMFAGDPAPFVMELPHYHFPTVQNIARSMYERGSAFARKAVTVYMLASILVWFAASFGWVDGSFGLVDDMDDSVLYIIGNGVAWIFSPLGFARWEATVATLMGIVAKEEVVGVFGVLTSIGDADVAFEMVDTMDSSGLAPIAGLFSSPLAAYSFLAFNLLCAPCFAAINTIRQEMNNAKWTWFAVTYECGFAYVVALVIYQLGLLYGGEPFTVWTGIALAIVAVTLYMLFRPEPKSVKVEKARGEMSAAA